MVLLKKTFLFICLVVVAGTTQAQPFAGEIRAFKKQDSVSFPAPHSILFIGSSSFRMWKDINEYFLGYPIINRGFGGSTLPDLIRYEDDIIFPYQPKQIVIYCGDNDIAASDTVTAAIVFDRFKKLFTDIRKKLPAVSIVYVSIKPSASRWTMKDRMLQANDKIRKFLKKRKHTGFVNVWKHMLGPDGKPWDALFLKDYLHMNADGYAIWKKLIEPHLIKQ